MTSAWAAAAAQRDGPIARAAPRRVVGALQEEAALAVAAEVLLGHGDHELDAVELVHLGGAGVVVHGHDVALRVHLAQALDHGLAHHVVGQARERRAARAEQGPPGGLPTGIGGVMPPP